MFDVFSYQGEIFYSYCSFLYSFLCIWGALYIAVPEQCKYLTVFCDDMLNCNINCFAFKFPPIDFRAI
jgi:hypothetical protein